VYHCDILELLTGNAAKTTTTTTTVADVVAALPKDATQHGYSPLHSCTTAILPIVTCAAVGFNEQNPTSRSAMCDVDIIKVFDAIDHTLLMEQIRNSVLNPNLVR
jgi:hypothetical protein